MAPRLCNLAWDSDVEVDERDWDLLADPPDDYECLHCSVQAEEPHFVLSVLQGRLSEPLSARSSLDMEASLWSSLPQELLERVLAMLPAASRFRLCAVCKSWRSLFSSPRFKQLCDVVGPVALAPICALEYKPGRLDRGCLPRPSDVSYLCASRGLPVHRLGLSFLPERFQRFYPSDCVVQSGLLCIFKAEPVVMKPGMVEKWTVLDEDVQFREPEGGFEAVRMSLCVANPLTRTWRELPPQYCTHEEYEYWRTDYAMDLKVEKSGRHFRVFVIGPRLQRGKKHLTVNSFSSKVGSWEVTYLFDRYATPDEDDAVEWPQYVVCKGLLYTAQAQSADLLVHRLEDGKFLRSQNWDNARFLLSYRWDNEEFLAQCQARLNNVFKLFGHGSRVLCVGKVLVVTRRPKLPEHIKLLRESFSRVELDYGVWELDQSRLLWHRVSLLPEHLQQLLLEPAQIDLHNEKRRGRIEGVKEYRLYLDGAFLIADTICLSFAVSGSGSSDTGPLWKHWVAYNILEDSWKLLCHGMIAHMRSNAFHLFQTSFTDVPE